jgi:hypothetical protein
MMSATLSRLSAPVSKLLLVALLAVPALYAPTPAADGENRRMAAAPSAPASVAELLAYPPRIDAWVNDHFGLRDALVRLNTRLRYRLFGQFPTPQVIAGREGRIFMATYQPAAAAYSGVFSACGYQQDLTAQLSGEIERNLGLLLAQGINARLLVVPSSPVVHSAQLPAWLSRACPAAGTPMSKLLAAGTLTPAVRERVDYPLALMQQAAASGDVFPRTFFHWGGLGPRLVSDWLVPHAHPGMSLRGAAYVSAPQQKPSDIGHIFPGLRLDSTVETLDLAKSGIEQCWGAACYPEMADVLAKFGESARYRNPAAPLGRLVMMSDSYGPPSWPWFARYYREVVAVNTNSMDALKPADLARLRAFLFSNPDDEVLVLYHDATVHAGRLSQDFKLLMP